MSLDIELILQALSKGFEELEAKWETRFSSGGVIHHGQEAASELPFPSPATTSYPAVADVAAAPTVPPEGADAAQEIPLASCVLSPAKDFAHGGSVDTECIDNFSLLPDVLLSDIVSRLPVKDAVRTAVLSRRWKPIWRVVPLVLVDTHICLAGEDKIPKHFVRSHSDDIAPAAPSAENVPTNYSHTRCLKVCLSHNITVPKPISVALTSISAHATSSASVDSYLNNFKQSSKAPDDPFAIYDRSVQVHRYITNYNLAYSISVASCRITLVHYGHVFEELSDQIAKILLQLLVSLIDMAPWPPPGELEAVCDNAEVRPSLWPSFNLAEGVNVGWPCSMMELCLEDIRRDCWRQWLEFLENILQAELAVYLLQSCQSATLSCVQNQWPLRLPGYRLVVVFQLTVRQLYEVLTLGGGSVTLFFNSAYYLGDSISMSAIIESHADIIEVYKLGHIWIPARLTRCIHWKLQCASCIKWNIIFSPIALVRWVGHAISIVTVTRTQLLVQCYLCGVAFVPYRPMTEYWRCLKYMLGLSIRGIIVEYNFLSMGSQMEYIFLSIGQLPTDATQLKDGWLSNVLVAQRWWIHMMDQCWQFRYHEVLIVPHPAALPMENELAIQVILNGTGCGQFFLAWVDLAKDHMSFNNYMIDRKTLAQCTRQNIFVLGLHMFPSPPLTRDQIGPAIIKSEAEAYENCEPCKSVRNIISKLLFYNLVLQDP